MCTELEKPAQVQKHENDQRHLFLYKMRAKYEMRVLKSDINVVFLCIQQLAFNNKPPTCAFPSTKLLPLPRTLTYLNRSGSPLIPQFFLCCRGAMLRDRLHQSPCNGDPPMTPNQLRLRASSHKDFSTTNSSGFTPDFE